MSQTIYKLYLGKVTESWHALSETEQRTLLAKVEAALKQVGGKPVVMCDPTWSTEQWHFWGVEEFPSIDAVMTHTKLLQELKWERYVDTMTVLGTKR